MEKKREKVFALKFTTNLILFINLPSLSHPLSLALSCSLCFAETFGNLLLLYCKHELYDIAADVMAENADLTFKNLTQVGL